MAVFTWFPDAEVSLSVEPKVEGARFGDGYEQRVGAGINNDPETWSLSFTGNRAEIDPIEQFLRNHNGYIAFDWKTPDEVTGRFICRKWRKTRSHGTKVIVTADFEQVFGS